MNSGFKPPWIKKEMRHDAVYQKILGVSGEVCITDICDKRSNSGWEKIMMIKAAFCEQGINLSKPLLEFLKCYFRDLIVNYGTRKRKSYGRVPRIYDGPPRQRRSKTAFKCCAFSRRI